MPAPKEVISMVERFLLNLEDYRSGKYNETQVRLEFIDPFFETLGWDVHNKKGYAEAYKDVVHEDQVKVGGATKAPDYGFRIGGTRKFFVEAKKPSISIKDDVHPAYQLRRYAWSAKLPLSILMDFEELAVYDCRIRPVMTDKTGTARVMYFTFNEYVEKWDEIAAIFSREAVLQGSFDRYAESSRRKRGTAEVDTAFLEEIERWREILARNIALRNPGLTVRDLNFAVQRTIDRIIFLRIAEDRGLEHYGLLRNLESQKDTYSELCRQFLEADNRYNSGLFHFKKEKGRQGIPDELTIKLNIDDKVLKDILRNLYYPDSPYEFSVLPAEILGQVYEQFLGRVIRLTAGGQAKVEDKPEVKKAGGVYYTPTYIVDYIVEQTVGKLLDGLTPRDAAKLKICDPACGSGSFLLGAYRYLLDWHRDFYVGDDPEKHTRAARGRIQALYQGMGDEWRLTTAEKRRILLNNIYGVDIDPQAVEVTKLSLLLKVLEGENEGSLNQQLAFFQERALPDLDANIKCGNSLIGPDFCTHLDQQLIMFDTEKMYRINAFNWEHEFSEIITAGGFNAVIGNPPYVRQEELGEVKSYFQTHYETFKPTADLYVNFIEKGLKLLQPNGLFGMIVSNKWLRAAYGRPLRKYLVEKASVKQVIDFAGLPVFPKATVRTIVIICAPGFAPTNTLEYVAPVQKGEFYSIQNGERIQEIVSQRAINVSISGLSAEGWAFSSAEKQNLMARMRKSSLPLTIYVEGKTYFGIKTGFNKAFIIDDETRNRIIEQDSKSTEIIKPILTGRDVRRYSAYFSNKYLIWTYVGVPIKNYPIVFNHLKQFHKILQTRWDKGNFWWELRACDYYELFEKPKIIYPDIATTCRFTLDSEGFFGVNTTYFIPGDDLYLLGILNSKLSHFYLSEVCAGLETSGGVYLRFFGQYLGNFPIHTIDFNNTTETAWYEQIVALVESILGLHKSLAAIKTPAEKQIFQRKILNTDQKIDALVYKLYGLMDEEIRIVEES